MQGAGKPEDHFLVPPVYIGGEGSGQTIRPTAEAMDPKRAAGSPVRVATGQQHHMHLSAPVSHSFFMHVTHQSAIPSKNCCGWLLLPCPPHAALDAYLFLRDTKAFEEETHKILARTVSWGKAAAASAAAALGGGGRVD